MANLYFPTSSGPTNNKVFGRQSTLSCFSIISITLLLPHTEGILWDLGMKKKLVRKGYTSKKKYVSYKNYDKDIDWELHELSSKLFPKDKFHGIIVNEIFFQ